MNSALDALKPYPFARLAELKAGLRPPGDREHIALSIGEPRHAAPDFVIAQLSDPAFLRQSLGTYPATRGTPALREALADWLQRRFGAPVDPETQVLPVAGTREALFSIAQAVLDPKRDSVVAMPNPFYQIYEGAALLGGGRPRYLPTLAEQGYRPDFDALTPADWREIDLLYLCTPGNPAGATLSLADLQQLLALAHEHDFVIVSDECYSEIYADESAPPPGLLTATTALGDSAHHRALVFNSLSKRSNLPGLRSGLVAGDAALLDGYLRYRTYQGCALPVHTQAVSALAWADEAHVRHNRVLYREKFDAVDPILKRIAPVQRPAGGFFYWLPVPGDDRAFAAQLFESEHVTVLPGQFLGRPAGAAGLNPGAGHVRIALVADLPQCLEGAERIARCEALW
ncbi:MAG: succinyldiaminopimelate transaminase [Pseudomonadota bacterium]